MCIIDSFHLIEIYSEPEHSVDKQIVWIIKGVNNFSMI